MDNLKKTRHRIFQLLATQRLAVLSTQYHGEPYANLVGFAADTDLRRIFFATPETTRKYRNLTADPRVALLIDSRSHQEADFHQAAAVTAVGKAAVVDLSADGESAADRYLSRHPYLVDFLRAPTTRLIQVFVDRYVLVENFQEVMELRM